MTTHLKLWTTQQANPPQKNVGKPQKFLGTIFLLYVSNLIDNESHSKKENVELLSTKNISRNDGPNEDVAKYCETNDVELTPDEALEMLRQFKPKKQRGPIPLFPDLSLEGLKIHIPYVQIRVTLIFIIQLRKNHVNICIIIVRNSM